MTYKLNVDFKENKQMTTKTKTPIVTVTTATGLQLKRATWRRYTHAVVLTEGAPRPVALAWCGSFALAEKQLAYWTGNGGKRLRWRYPVDGFEVAILPVNGPALPGDVFTVRD